MPARDWHLLGLLSLTLAPLACADLLGLQRGVLDLGDGSAGANTPGSAGLDGSGGASGGVPSETGGVANGGSPASAGAMSGGADVGGSDAGAPGSSDGGEPNMGPCKNGTCTECPPGMKMSRSSELHYYCIDAAEVTNQQYLAFTERYTTASVIASTACANNASLVPDTACSTALTDVPSRQLPVVCVDYCDAEAYCNMQGKRLCGRVGGTMNDPGDNVNAAASEWYAACSGPFETIYPYGDAASATNCNSSGYSPSDMGPRDLATMSECEGGYEGIYNMSGNVAEWEWSCSSTSSNAPCSTRGGSYLDGPYEVRCSGTINLGRHEYAENVGFRCCANLKD
jgi:formylglycine-generating enzyme